jgi:hypothetical protein
MTRSKQRRERKQAARAAAAAARGKLAAVRRRLLELAQDVRSTLRLSPNPAMRMAAALLLAGSMAACIEMDPPEALTDAPLEQVVEVQPLAQEVRSGLPLEPGTYPLKGDQVRRDPQGVYYFAWRGKDDPADRWRDASASLVRLKSDSSVALEVPASGDPVLHLKSDTPVMLSSVGGGPVATPTPGGASHASYMYYGRPWYPLYHPISVPSYYDPPRTVAASTTEVRESRPSTAPKAAAERTASVPAASGRAGGTGAGTAVSSKAGVSNGGKSGFLGIGGSSSSGVASAKSGSFSSGSSSSSSSSSS